MDHPKTTLVLVGALPPGPTPDLDLLHGAFDEVVLVTDAVEDYLALDLTVVAPLGPLPLGALVAALTISRHETVVAVDAIGFSTTAMDGLTEAPGDVVLADRSCFLPGRYSRAVLRRLERALKAGQTTVEQALRGVKVVVV